MSVRFEVSYGSTGAFLEAFEGELAHGGLLVRHAGSASAQRGESCGVVVRVGSDELELDGTVAMVRGSMVSVHFEALPDELGLLVDRLRKVGAPSSRAIVTPPHGIPIPRPTPPSTDADTDADTDTDTDTDAAKPDAAHGTVAQRLAELTVPQKLALALHCDRETRIGLFRDHNKTVHVYVLKNPRIGLDEVTWACKQTTLSPDALKLISEHPEWGSNATICAGLVRNPRTPLPIATRLLSKLHTSELKAIAKGGARDQLVQAARKMVHAG